MRVGHMDKITGQTPFYTSIKSHSIASRAKFAKLQPKTQRSSFKIGVKHGGFHQIKIMFLDHFLLNSECKFGTGFVLVI